MAFFSSAIDTLQTLVIALGAGLGVWGVVNLLEGYGSDNPGSKAHGCLPYDCTTVYTAAFFQSSHTLTKIIVAINDTTIIIKMQRFSKV